MVKSARRIYGNESCDVERVYTYHGTEITYIIDLNYIKQLH